MGFSKSISSPDTCGTFKNNSCKNNMAHFYGDNFASYPRDIKILFKNVT